MTSTAALWKLCASTDEIGAKSLRLSAPETSLVFRIITLESSEGLEKIQA